MKECSILIKNKSRFSFIITYTRSFNNAINISAPSTYPAYTNFSRKNKARVGGEGEVNEEQEQEEEEEEGEEKKVKATLLAAAAAQICFTTRSFFSAQNKLLPRRISRR